MSDKFFYRYIFFVALIIILGPALSTGRIWAFDTQFHVRIINIMKEGGDIEGFIDFVNIDHAYSKFYYHKFYYYISLITTVDAHGTLLYIAPIIQFSIFYSGIYLIITKMIKFDPQINKRLIFTVFIFIIIYFLSFSVMTPMGLLYYFMPLLCYYCYKLTPIHILYIILINIFCVGSHLYGVLMILFTGVFIGIKFVYYYLNLEKKRFKFTYFHVLIVFILFYGVVGVLILFPTIFDIAFSILPFPNKIEDQFINGWFSGGTFIRERFSSSLYRAIQAYYKFSFILFTITYDFYFYLRSWRRKEEIKTDFITYFRAFTDVLSIITVLSLFYGNDIKLFRITTFLMPFYVLLTILNLIDMYHLIHSINFLKPVVKIIEFFDKTKVNGLLICFLFFSTLTVYDVRTNYTEEEYNAVYWLDENLPDNSCIISSVELTRLILGLTMKMSHINTERIFSDFEKSQIQSTLDRNYTYYMLLDLDPPHTFNKIPFHAQIDDPDLFMEIVYNSTIYSLIYNRDNIHIYYINTTIA